MKTSVIEVHDMLSVWNVDETEKRIGEVPGVKSVTVNFAAGSATVRYDETWLEVADIKSAVRQRGHEPDAPAEAGDGHEGHAAPGTTPATPASPVSESSPAAPVTAPVPAASKSDPDDAAAALATKDKQQAKTHEETNEDTTSK